MFLREAEILLPPWEVGLTGHFGLQPGEASDSRSQREESLSRFDDCPFGVGIVPFWGGRLYRLKRSVAVDVVALRPFIAISPLPKEPDCE